MRLPSHTRAHTHTTTLSLRSAKREAERIQREMEEREQEELKAYLAARGKKVSEGEKLDVKAITKVGGQESCVSVTYHILRCACVMLLGARGVNELDVKAIIICGLSPLFDANAKFRSVDALASVVHPFGGRCGGQHVQALTWPFHLKAAAGDAS